MAKKKLNYTSMDSLKNVDIVLYEASIGLGDTSRTIGISAIPVVLGSISDAGTDASRAKAALDFLLHEVLVGVGVVWFAPIKILVNTYDFFFKRKDRLFARKQELYKIALEKQNTTIQQLKNQADENSERIKYLESLNTILLSTIESLKADIEE